MTVITCVPKVNGFGKQMRYVDIINVQFIERCFKNSLAMLYMVVEHNQMIYGKCLSFIV